MKKLMLGNEAVARGLYEAGCAFVSSYPGTPSTEITEFAAKKIYAEWAPNEKVAVEAAFGASLAGTRAFSGMKHVGLNVAADPVFTASYTGVNAGLVIAVADDPGMHSSQNEQDSRHYARASKLLMLEPADSGECLEYTKLAFEMSEKYDTPVLLRLSTRVSHAQSAVELSEPLKVERKPYVKDPVKYLMVPANARKRHTVVEKRMAALAEWAETAGINKTVAGNSKVGIIASGIAYQTAREALGDKASYLKLGVVYPMPSELIKNFAATVDELYVIEELDPVIENHCKCIGIACKGKELFSLEGEYTTEMIRNRILGVPMPDVKPANVPVRPPVLCPGCPHRGLFHVLNKMKLTVLGDIGCYSLGAAPPLSATDMILCMGASVSAAHGFLKAYPEAASKTVAVIGDSTFMHSGITGLMNAVYNQSPCTLLILDNSITGMTGHQHNPSTGLTLTGKPAPTLDIEKVCLALGVEKVTVVDPHELKELECAVKEHLDINAPSVVIARRPCVLLPTVPKQDAYTITDKCKNCGSCMKIGCPAIKKGESSPSIDQTLCVGCELCGRMCAFSAIERGGVK